ncbi:MAG: DUF192 domain-containing protein [Candidatus Pacebacteria bacterium]|nr:DUF192 domain-containing protein [Candidatus Paceibacterota bacterium]
MKFIKKHLFILIILLVLLWLFLVILTASNQNQGDNKKMIGARLGSCVFSLEIVSDPLSWYKGLSHREALDQDKGMIFIFPDKKTRTFVMREMNFPLDIIFLKDKKVINIEQANLEIAKDNNLREYKSQDESNMVVEINQGLSKKCEIKTDTTLKFLD